jgi:hypothetical protein
METVLGGLAFAFIVVGQVLAVIAARGRIAYPRSFLGSTLKTGVRVAKSAMVTSILVSSSVHGAVAAEKDDHQKVEIPGTGFELTIDDRKDPLNDLITPSLLSAISTWLVNQFDLASSDSQPRIEVATPQKLATLRYRGLMSSMTSNQVNAAERDTVAIYVDTERTIILSSEWTGSRVAYLSVLVHEMVHHLQNLAGLKYECPQAREKLAYKAQNRWLGLFAHSLEEDFGLDGFSLLPKISCMN